MVPHIRQVQIRNYKSIGQAVVDVGPFCVLVGPNGAGKSNFVDALAFVRDCVEDSVEQAFTARGGIRAVRRRSKGHPTHIGMRLILDLDPDLSADYAFEIAAKPKERFRIAKERCVIRRLMKEEYGFTVEDGELRTRIEGLPSPSRVPQDRLALYPASYSAEPLRPLYYFLSSMRFHSIAPDRVRELQEPDPGDALKSDGSNAAAVLKRLREASSAEDGERYSRVCRLLSKVVEGLSAVDYKQVADKETLQFKQEVVGDKYPWTFDALNMSDGTLRVLALLLAVYQRGYHTLIAIEEPEATVHPALTELVVQVLMDAATERQILLTTHSPDILDHKEVADEHIRVVTADRGQTLISPVSASSREAIRQRLYTPGELLREDELNADTEAAQRAAAQLTLFGAPFAERRAE